MQVKLQLSALVCAIGSLAAKLHKTVGGQVFFNGINSTTLTVSPV
jgi:hypothetical protein